MSYKSHVYGERESHSGIVPTKRSNAGRGGPKEIVEGRPLTKENAEEPNPYRTPSRESGPSGLDRVRRAAKGDPKMRFTALLHHVNINLLRSSDCQHDALDALYVGITRKKVNYVVDLDTARFRRGVRHPNGVPDGDRLPAYQDLFHKQP